jgi:hypothetical protein
MARDRECVADRAPSSMGADAWPIMRNVAVDHVDAWPIAIVVRPY